MRWSRTPVSSSHIYRLGEGGTIKLGCGIIDCSKHIATDDGNGAFQLKTALSAKIWQGFVDCHCRLFCQLFVEAKSTM